MSVDVSRSTQKNNFTIQKLEEGSAKLIVLVVSGQINDPGFSNQLANIIWNLLLKHVLLPFQSSSARVSRSSFPLQTVYHNTNTTYHVERLPSCCTNKNCTLTRCSLCMLDHSCHCRMCSLCKKSPTCTAPARESKWNCLTSVGGSALLVKEGQTFKHGYRQGQASDHTMALVFV